MSLKLIKIPKSDAFLREKMGIHYSKPKGFVGRSICYQVVYNNDIYGVICGGSATLYLPGRNEFFSIPKGGKFLNNIVNNIFYHIEPIEGKYPIRNFTTYVLSKWREQIMFDWKDKYGDDVMGFESLVELPRSGELYKRDNWFLVGQTKGFQVKRPGGVGSDGWSGRRQWITDILRPKLVFCR